MTRIGRLLVAALRAITWLVVLPFLKRRLALPKLVRTVWTPPRKAARDPVQERDVVALVRALYRLRGVVADDNCLERSLVTYRLLARLSAEPTLIAGMRKDGADPRGHVWVAVDGEPVRESEALLRELVPIMSFDARGKLVAAGPPGADPAGHDPRPAPREPSDAPEIRCPEA